MWGQDDPPTPASLASSGQGSPAIWFLHSKRPSFSGRLSSPLLGSLGSVLEGRVPRAYAEIKPLLPTLGIMVHLPWDRGRLIRTMPTTLSLVTLCGGGTASGHWGQGCPVPAAGFASRLRRLHVPEDSSRSWSAPTRVPCSLLRPKLDLVQSEKGRVPKSGPCHRGP